MDFVFGVFFVTAAFSLVVSFIGGFAGAIAGEGREDRSLLANTGIGLVGWLVAGTVWTVATGSWPEELSAELLLLALGASIGFAWLLDRRDRVRGDSVGGHPG